MSKLSDLLEQLQAQEASAALDIPPELPTGFEKFARGYAERLFEETPEHLKTLSQPGGGTLDPRTMALTGMPMADLSDPLVAEQKRAQTLASTELFGTALGPASTEVGEFATEQTGSKIAGLLAELGVGLLEAGGVGMIPKLIGKQAPKAAVKQVAKKAAVKTPEAIFASKAAGRSTPEARFMADLSEQLPKRPPEDAGPVVKQILEPDEDFFTKNFPPPELPPGPARELLPEGAVAFRDLKEAAAFGHIPSFRNAGMMLGQSAEEMEAAVQALSRNKVNGHYVSNELRGATYTEYLSQAEMGFPDKRIIDDLRPLVQPTAQPARAPAAVSRGEELIEGFGRIDDPTEVSPVVKAWVNATPDPKVRTAAEGIKTGRPFSLPPTLMFQLETGLKKALRLGGLNNTQAKAVIGLSRSSPGLGPNQRVLFAQQWESMIKPLLKADPAKAKVLSQKLVKDAQDLIVSTKATLSAETDKLLVDPRVGEALGGRSIWQMKQILGRATNEVHSMIKDDLTTFSGEDLQRYVTGLMKSTPHTSLARKVKELRAASMLSRVGTHIRNMVTTTSNIIAQPVVTVASAGTDIARHNIAKAFGRASERQIYAGEALAQLVGWKQGLPDVLRAFGRDARAVREIVDPARLSAFKGPIRHATTLSFKALAAEDSAMFNWAFSGEMFRVAYRKAIRQGLKGKAALTRAEQIIKNETTRPGRLLDDAIKKADEAMEGLDIDIDTVPNVRREYVHQALREGGETEIDEALELAERTIFTAREGRRIDTILTKVDELDQLTHGGVSLAAPFRRTPANLIREAIRNSPMGLVTAVTRSQGGRGGARVLSQELGRAALGSAAMLSAMLMHKAGWLQIHPFDKAKTKAQRTLETAAGTMQDGITLGNYSFPIDRLEPMGSLLLASARASDAFEAGKEGEYVEMLNNLALEFPKAMIREGFLEDFADIIDAMGDEKKMERLTSRVGMSFVPGIIPEMRRAFVDPRAKDIEGEVKLGLFGMEQDIGGPLSIVTGRRLKRNDDPLINHMLKIGAVALPPSTQVPDLKGSHLELSEDEEYTLGKAKGLYQRDRVTRLFTNPAYHRLPEEKQRSLIKKQFDKAGKIINNRVRVAKKQGKMLHHRDLLKGLIK